MKIRYKDEGKGPAIVLMHGSYSALDNYDALAAALSKNHRVIRFDLPGMGLSETLSADAATTTPFGDDVMKALLDKLGIDKFVLVGTSSGGSISYYFAARFPDRVTALVLCNTPADPVFNDKVPRIPELDVELKRAAQTGYRDLRYWTVYMRVLAGDPSRPSKAWIERYYDMGRRILPKKAHYFWRSTQNAQATQATIAEVKAPTLLIWGTVDNVLPLPSMDVLKGYLKNATVSEVVLTDVGHYPPFDAPNRVATLLEGYLKAITPAVSGGMPSPPPAASPDPGPMP